MGGALYVKAIVQPLSLYMALRVFSSSPLFLRLYTGCRARRRTPGRKGGYTSLFIVTFYIYILLLCPGRGDL